MKPLRLSGAFKKDVGRMTRRGNDTAKLGSIITAIRRGDKLPASCSPHPLKGEWKGYWDCHIQSDWLLIYKVTDDEVLLARTGTHSDLFE